jgi:hypothetical protein
MPAVQLHEQMLPAFTLKCKQWLYVTPVIPATREVKVEGSQAKS